MELSPGLKKFLDKIGVNTTRLQWKLYQREKRKEEAKGEPRMPSNLRWVKYSHKFCPDCNNLVDRDERICPSCGASLPSIGLYRIGRLIALIMPKGGAVTVMAFIGLMAALYVLSIFIHGPGAIMNPPIVLLRRFGYQTWALVDAGQYWRMLSFGLFHAGLIHIGFNTLALIQVGPAIEAEIGSKRMLVLITVSQIASGLAVYYAIRFPSLVQYREAVGASGWLFGLIGFGIAYFHRHGRGGLATRNFFVQWAVYGLVFGLIFGFNNVAHAGGMAGGLVLGMTADLTKARRTLWTGLWDYLTWPCVGVWLATLIYLARSIFFGGD